jgi:methylenetetrahydrofolate dehydrogenase (NADP+)/methenyltetrahydrofolate cyclohydrolase
MPSGSRNPCSTEQPALTSITTRLIDGTALAARLRAELAARVATLKARGITPGLGVLLVGEDPASQVYVRSKTRACAEIGLLSEQTNLPADATQQQVLDRVRAMNADARIHGILVQLPLPAQVSAQAVLEAIDPSKDVDGFHLHNVGALVTGSPRFVPCTPAGVMRLIDAAGVDLAGKHAVVLGRSNIVGKPVAMLLLERNATVTICHSKTADLAAVTRSADVLVAAIGRPKFVGAGMVKPGAVVIDVGINRTPEGKLCGDADFDALQGIAGAITPVPGGVGPMTIAMLLANTVQAAEHERTD